MGRATRRQTARPRQVEFENALGPSPPWRHHDHPAGKQNGLVDGMRDEDHRLARRQPERLEVDTHLLAGQRIERAERFVHEQKRRAVQESPRDRSPLPHAARQFVRKAVG